MFLKLNEIELPIWKMLNGKLEIMVRFILGLLNSAFEKTKMECKIDYDNYVIERLSTTASHCFHSLPQHLSHLPIDSYW